MTLTTVLRRRVGPAAIARRVMAVVVDAVKAGALWAWPHVSKERLETINPLGANCDAASAPPLEAHGVRIQTATFHRRPRSVFATPRLTAFRRAARMSVGDMRRSFASQSRDALASPASAAFRDARNNQSRTNDFRLTAIAATDPSMVRRDRCHHESMETIPGRDR